MDIRTGQRELHLGIHLRVEKKHFCDKKTSDSDGAVGKGWTISWTIQVYFPMRHL